MRAAEDIILAPVITEASMDGIANKVYTFRVLSSATKAEIASAVETMFKGTKVAKVNVINMKRKPKRLGASEGYTSEWKKAIVQLKSTSKTIEFFDGLN